MIRLAGLLFFLALVVPAANAQQSNTSKPQLKRMQFSADNAVIIRELGAVIVEENNKVIVKFIPPKDRRPKEVTGEDIESGDEVGMANGKRVSAILELRKLYDEAAIGSEFKLGVRREGQPHLVVFLKKDPKDAMPGGMMMISGGGDGNEVFPALGISLEQRGKKVVIGKALPNILEGLKEGDQIESLNEKNVETVKDFATELDATKVGSELKFGLVRDGKKTSYSVPRPKPRGQMIFKND